MIDYRNNILHKHLIVFGKDLISNTSSDENIKADGPYFIKLETKTKLQLIRFNSDKHTQPKEGTISTCSVSTCCGGRALRNIYRDSTGVGWYMLTLYNPKYNNYLEVYMQGFKSIRGK